MSFLSKIFSGDEPTNRRAAKTFRRSVSRLATRMFGFAGGEVSDTDKWVAIPEPIDNVTSKMWAILVGRSRDQLMNNEFVQQYARLMRVNIIGPNGIILRSNITKNNGDLDTKLNKSVEKAWQRSANSKNFDVTLAQNFTELCCLMINSYVSDGEIFIRKAVVDGKPSIQLIDPMRCPVTYTVQQYGIGGNFIKFGIEYTSWGRPVAYHFTSTDANALDYYSVGGNGYVRVPAEQIIHSFIRDFVGQKRGFPWCSTPLFRLRNLNKFEHAAVQNARAGATNAGVIEWDVNAPDAPETDGDCGDLGDAVSSEPLAFTELPAGAKLNEFKSQYPNNEIIGFNSMQLKAVSAAWGVSYHSLSGDLTSVSFSSIRAGTLIERDNFEMVQAWFISDVIKPIFRWWLEVSLLNGDITSGGKPVPAFKLTDIDDNATWQGRRWTWVDPNNDVTAKQKELRTGTTAPSFIITEQGRDPGDVYRAIADDIKEMKKAGISDDIIKLFFTGEINLTPKGGQSAETNQTTN